MARPTAREGTRPYLLDGLWILKVRGSNGTWYNRSTGTDDEDTAHTIADTMHELRRLDAWDVIDMIATKNAIKLGDYYARHVAMAKAHPKLNAAAVGKRVAKAVGTPGLAALKEQWERAKHPDPAYVRSVGYFLDWLKRQPECSELPASAFTAEHALAFVNPDHDDPRFGDYSGETRRKMRVALSQFGKYLVQKEAIAANPVSSESGVEITFSKEELDRRSLPIYYKVEDIQRMVRHPNSRGQLRALIALMFSGAVEWSAAQATRVSDVNRKLRTVLARGEKDGANGARTRTVIITHDWCWQVIETYLDTLPAGTVWLFPRAEQPTRYKKAVKQRAVPRMQEKVIREAFMDLCAALGIEHHGFHKFRHSFAVHWVQQGCMRGRTGKLDEVWAKRQMGHRTNSVLFHTTYGKFDKQEEVFDIAQSLRDDSAAHAPKKRGARGHLAIERKRSA